MKIVILPEKIFIKIRLSIILIHADNFSCFKVIRSII